MELDQSAYLIASPWGRPQLSGIGGRVQLRLDAAAYCDSPAIQLWPSDFRFDFKLMLIRCGVADRPVFPSQAEARLHRAIVKSRDTLLPAFEQNQAKPGRFGKDPIILRA